MNWMKFPDLYISMVLSSVLPNKVQPFFGDVWTRWCRRRTIKEAAWLSGQCVGLAIRQSRVQVPLWPLAEFVLCGPEFKSSAMLVNSQLVASCLFNPFMLYVNYLFLRIIEYLYWFWEKNPTVLQSNYWVECL